LRRRDRAGFVRAPTRHRTLHALRPTIAQGWRIRRCSNLDRMKHRPRSRHRALSPAANVSSLAPFNTYRITQDYRDEEGKLVELVELFKKKGDAEQPWVKNNEEEARLFRVRTFDGPPTRLSAR
jgi:hypothetical protein